MTFSALRRTKCLAASFPRPTCSGFSLISPLSLERATRLPQPYICASYDDCFTRAVCGGSGWSDEELGVEELGEEAEEDICAAHCRDSRRESRNRFFS